MNNSEKNILAYLLDRATDEFARHGCNDYVLENTDENWELILKVQDKCCEGREQYIKDFGDRPGPKAKLYTQDWLLMAYFSKVIFEESK